MSRTPLIRVTAMPADTNPYGGVFGGWLMSQMALAAGSLASRQARGKAVVVALNEVDRPRAIPSPRSASPNRPLPKGKSESAPLPLREREGPVLAIAGMGG